MSDHTLQDTTFAVTTLGCKVNQADSEAIGEQMSAAGFVQRDFDEAADVYIVNTCTVTHVGDRSSRQMIAQAHRRHPDALLVVTGCYAELNPEAVAALPGVDLVVGNSQKETLVEAIAQKRHSKDATPATELTQPDAPAIKGRSLPVLPLDTQHIGSDGTLTFDPTEPQPENPARLSPFTDSAHTTDAILRLRKVRTGYQEIVLTGIHLGDYHPEDDEKRDLGDLIAALLRETEIARIRVSSLEPEDFRLEWLAHWENPRMCRHFHLPMQSGSDAILRRMARRYNSSRYETIITTAKR